MADYLYYAIVLSKDSREKILRAFAKHIPIGWSVYADHITLMHHSKHCEEFKQSLEELLKHTIFTHIINIGKSDKAIALQVGIPSTNEITHITLAVAPGAKPVESNNITNWKPVTGLEIEGDLEKIIAE